MSDFEKDFSQALCMMTEREYAEAVRLFDSVIEQEPVLADAYARRGQAKYFLDDNSGAIEDAEIALGIDPENVYALTTIARIALDSEDYEKSHDYFTKALEIDPDYIGARNMRGILYLDTDRNSDAVNDFSEVLRVYEDDRFALLHRAWGYNYLLMREEAFEDNDRLLGYNPENSEGLYQRGFFYRTSGQYEKALKYFEMAIRFDLSDHHTYWRYKGSALLFLDRAEEALEAFERSIEIYPSLWTFYEAGVALRRLGRFEESTQKLLSAMELAKKENLQPTVVLLQDMLESANLDDTFELPLINEDIAFALNVKAGRLYNENRYEEALKIMDEIISICPGFVSVYSNKARIYTAIDEYERALECADIALRYENKIAHWSLKGEILVSLGRYDEAIDIYSEILDEEMSAETLCLRADAYYRKKEYELSNVDLTKALEIGDEKDFDEYLQKRAWNYSLMEQYDNALADYARILYYIPNHVGVLHERALVYFDLNRYEEAIRDEILALNRAPDFRMGYTVRGDSWGRLAMEIEEDGEDRIVSFPEISEILDSKEIYDSEECWRLAFADLDKAIEMISENTAIFWTRGYFCIKREMYAESRDAFRTVLEASPEKLSALYWIAKACEELGLFEEAIDYANKGIRLDPEFSGLFDTKGYALTYLFRFEEAEQMFRRSLELDPDDAYIFCYLAYVIKRLGRFEETLEMLNDDLEYIYDYPLAFFTRVETLISSGRLDGAEEQLRISIEKTPNQARAYSMLAELLELREDTSGAKELYEKAIQSTSTSWDPSTINMLYRGIAMAALGDHEPAIRCFIDSLSESELKVSSNESDYRLACSYYALGRFGEARTHAERALEYLTKTHDWKSRIEYCRKLLEKLEKLLTT